MLHSIGIPSNRDRLEVVIFPAIDVDRIESTALDGGTDAI